MKKQNMEALSWISAIEEAASAADEKLHRAALGKKAGDRKVLHELARVVVASATTAIQRIEQIALRSDLSGTDAVEAIGKIAWLSMQASETMKRLVS